MFWFESMLRDDYIEYFKDENSVYFTVTSKGKEYHEVYKNFKETLIWILALYSADVENYEEDFYYRATRGHPELEVTRVVDIFFQDKRKIEFRNIACDSMGGVLYSVDVNSLTPDELAIYMTMPFMSRMGGSFEDDFAESGKLREYYMRLYEITNVFRKENG